MKLTHPDERKASGNRSVFAHPRRVADADQEAISCLDPSNYLLPWLPPSRMHEAIAALNQLLCGIVDIAYLELDGRLRHRMTIRPLLDVSRAPLFRRPLARPRRDIIASLQAKSGGTSASAADGELRIVPMKAPEAAHATIRR